MLKKSLIVIAVLAIAMPAIAVDAVKYHKPWTSETTTVYKWKQVGQINVVMDVGYWIQLDYNGDIEVYQTTAVGNNPYTSYKGCVEDITVKSNFPATLKASVASASAAGGTWAATLDGVNKLNVPAGNTPIDICVTGVDVKIDQLQISSQSARDNVKVAVVTISVVPQEFAAQAE